MLPKEAKYILFKASAAYPNQVELEDETITVWIERLANVPVDWGIANLNYHIDTKEFFPKIADITRYDLLPLKNHDTLRLETAEQFALLEHWSKNDDPPPDGYWESVKAKLRGDGK